MSSSLSQFVLNELSDGSLDDMEQRKLMENMFKIL